MIFQSQLAYICHHYHCSQCSNVIFSLALFCLVAGLALHCQHYTCEARAAKAHLICTPVTGPSYQYQQEHFLQLASCILCYGNLSIYRSVHPSDTATLSTCILSVIFLAFSHKKLLSIGLPNAHILWH
jgi:hypothetical protein